MSIRVGSQIVAGNAARANQDLSNLTSVGQNIANWSSNVTNCITEIPQDIKLELNAGVLTLKAGSKVYVPNGAGVFDEVVIPNDIIIPGWANNAQGMLSIKPSTSDIWISLMNQQYSGSTTPTSSQYELWYDTDSNKVKTTSNTGSTWTDGYSLPLVLITSNGSSWTSIDQVFNGFGYIGSTVFVLPGIKGLIPDGRNADGSLKNVSFTVANVLTYTNTVSYTGDLYILVKSNAITCWTEYQNSYTICGNVYYSSGKVNRFTPKTVFHAVDYSDTEFIGHQAMPSDRYISLTLGASGASYTAPADGYFYTYGITSATDSWIYYKDTSNGMISETSQQNQGYGIRCWIPASKGQTIQFYFQNYTNTAFRFVYANGSK